MIKITKFTVKPDAPEDQIEEFDCATVTEACKHFDQEANSLVARCQNDGEYFGMLFGVRRPNDIVAAAAIENIEPGAIIDGTMIWQFKGQLVDGAGWRVIFGREPTKLQKPKLPPAEPVERGSAIGKPVAVEKTETKNGEARP